MTLPIKKWTVGASAFFQQRKTTILTLAAGIALVVFAFGYYLFSPLDVAPPTSPQLTLNLETHSQAVRAIHIVPDERLVVTASVDGTIKVWSRSTGRVIRTLRTPLSRYDNLTPRAWAKTTGVVRTRFERLVNYRHSIDSGKSFEPRLFASALSPDGRFLAVGGSTTKGGYTDINVFPEQIFIFDINRGELVHRLKGLPDAVLSLSYSPDGRYLAAGVDIGEGVWIWDTKTWKVFKKIDVRDGAELDLNARSYTVWATDFAKDGKFAFVVEGTFDKAVKSELRVFDKNFAPYGRERIVTRGWSVGELYFSPDSQKIAVAYSDQLRAIDIYPADLSDDALRLEYPDDYSVRTDALTCEAQKAAGESGKGEPYEVGVRAIGWSPDGRSIYSASNKGKTEESREEVYLAKWSIDDPDDFVDQYAVDGTITEMAVASNGDVIFGTYHGGIGAHDKDLKPILSDLSERQNFWKTYRQFLVSENTASVQTLAYRNRKPVFSEFDLENGRYRQRESSIDDASFFAPVTVDGDVDCSCWVGDPDRYRNQMEWRGTKLEIPAEVTSCAFIPGDGESPSGLIVGTREDIRIYSPEADGRLGDPVLAKTSGEPGMLHGGNGLVFVAAYADGRIAWFDRKTGEEIEQAYLHPDGSEWVAWRRDGEYHSSLDAERFLGWQVSAGNESQPRFYPVSRFRDEYWNPDIAKYVLDRHAASARKTAITKLTPPAIDIVSDTILAKVEEGTTDLELRVERPTQQLLIYDDKDLMLERLNVSALPRNADNIIKISVKAPPGARAITLRATERNGEISDEKNVILDRGSDTFVIDDPTGQDKPVHLYLLSIGVDKYQDHEHVRSNLNYAVNDADVLEKLLTGPETGVGDKLVFMENLRNEQATVRNIDSELDRMISATDNEDDARKVAIVYLSGHGVVEKLGNISENYVFLGYDGSADPNDVYGVEASQLMQSISRLNVDDLILIIDTCHAGQAFEDGSAFRRSFEGGVREARDFNPSAMIFASAAASQQAKETPSLKHGVFTYVLLRGLSGEASFISEMFPGNDDVIDAAELKQFVEACFEHYGGEWAQSPLIDPILHTTTSKAKLARFNPDTLEFRNKNGLERTKAACGM